MIRSIKRSVFLYLGLVATLILSVQSVLAQAPNMVINQGVGGSWFNPATNGQGFLFEAVPSTNTLVAYWFTYTPEGDGPAWFIATGDISGPAGSLTVFVTDGGIFDDNAEVTESEWGTGDLVFTDCTNAQFDYLSMAGDLEGSIPLRRLTPDVDCQSSLADAQTTFVTAGNSWTDAQGAWFFNGCVQLGDNESHGDELFVFAANTLTFEIDHYNSPDCSGMVDVQSSSFLISRVDKTMAALGEQQVIANRVTMTDIQTQETVKQIFYINDDASPDEMTHGNFSEATDAEGYPAVLHEELFTR